MKEIILIIFTVIVGIGLGTMLPSVFSKEFRDKVNVKPSTAKWASAFLLCLAVLSLWYETPTKLGEFVYIERDLIDRSQTIHTSSSCPKIKKGYVLNEVGYYKYNPYLDHFCPRCFYNFDVVKLTKGKK